MATRIVARYISRRLSSGGKVLSEEEKAAENIYIKKMEGEKLDKAARRGPKPGVTPAAVSSVGSGPIADAKAPSGGTVETPTNVSTEKHRNYGVIAGIATMAAAFGWENSNIYTICLHKVFKFTKIC